jgi:hypothetical protein
MDNVVWIIGILIAFVLGAYVRAPFSFKKEAQQVIPPPAAPPELTPEEKESIRRENEREEQLRNMLAFNGKVQK